MSTVALIACSAAKCQSASPARDLYLGELFRRSRLMVERSGIRWAILSAKHGVVQPDRVIEPYDKIMPASAKARPIWVEMVVNQLVSTYPEGTHFMLLAGARYRVAFDPSPFDRELGATINPRLYGFTYEAPMEGLGIGHQKQWLALHTQPVGAAS